MNNKMVLAVLGYGLLSGPGILAQEQPIPGLRLQVDATVKIDDNIYRVNTGVTDDMLLQLNPNVEYFWLFGKHSAELGYDGEYAVYVSNSSENYVDHLVRGDLLLDLTPRLDLEIETEYQQGHDFRGESGTSLTVSAKPDQWKTTLLSTKLTYGRRTNLGQIVLTGEGLNWRYTNNGQETRDHDRTSLASTFFYNMSDKTSWLFEIRSSSIDYKPAANNFDSTENQYLIGVRWEATAKTSGEVRVGTLDKDLDDASLEDFGGTNYTAAVTWLPKTYSELELSMSRVTQESPQATSSYYVSDNVRLDWTHDFTNDRRLTSVVSLTNDEYSNGRNDDLLDFGINYGFPFNNWLGMGMEYQYSTRDSSVTGIDYDDNIFLLTLTVTGGQG